MLTDLLKRVRRNHALEHATVAILLSRGLRPPLGGYSTPGGFFIISRASKDEVVSAAHEALSRLNGSEKNLAISPYCGTNLATGAFLAGATTNLVLGKRRSSKLGQFIVILALLLGAVFLGRRWGMMLQRKYTTLSDTERMEILSTRSLVTGIHRVTTRS